MLILDGRHNHDWHTTSTALTATLGITRDDRLVEVISFIRYAWTNDAATVTTEEVKKLRREHAGRPAPWTDEELKRHVLPKP